MGDRLGIPGSVDFCLYFLFSLLIFLSFFKLFYHENINFVEKPYFFILYNQIHVYIAKYDVKDLHSGFIFRENTSHYKVGG